MLITVIIFLGIFLSAFLGALGAHASNGDYYVRLFYYFFGIGVVAHEGAHYLMCKLFGVKVKEVRFFKVERNREYLNIGGYVRSEEVSSFIAILSLSLAPLLVNGILVSLIYYCSPLWMEIPGWNFGIGFAGVSLALGTRPSKQDLSLLGKTLQKNLGRGLIEIIFLCAFGGVICYFAISQVEAWIFLAAVITFIVSCIILGRIRTV